MTAIVVAVQVSDEPILIVTDKGQPVARFEVAFLRGAGPHVELFTNNISSVKLQGKANILNLVREGNLR